MAVLSNPFTSVSTRRRGLKLPKSLGWWGIDLGVSTTKIAQLQKTSQGLQLARTWEVSSPHEPWDATTFATAGWPRIVSELALAKDMFRGRQTAAVTSIALTDYQSLDIPPGSHAEQREMIALEMQPEDDTAAAPCFDFWESPRQGKSDVGQSPLSVTSMPHACAMNIAQGLKGIGLTCRTLDALPCALARAAVLHTRAVATRPVVMIDVGYSATTVVVAQDGAPLLTRVLRDRGLQSWLKTIESGLQLSTDNAARVMVKFGLPGAEATPANNIAGTIWQITSTATDKFLGEIKRTMTFIDQRFRAYPVEEIILCGGGALTPNLANSIAQASGKPASLWQMPSSTKRDTTADARFAVAAALSALAWEGKRCT